MRLNRCSPSTIERLQACQKNVLVEEEGVLPTVLNATRAEVKEDNERELRRLEGDLELFQCHDNGKGSWQRFQKQLDEMVPQVIPPILFSIMFFSCPCLP